MSVLTHLEKQKLERLFGMASGYVLDFSKRTFEEFFREVVGVEIYNSRYDRASGSKANRMRAFWDVASERQIVALLRGLKEGWELYGDTGDTDSAHALLSSILDRLDGRPARNSASTDVSRVPRLATDVSRELSKTFIDLASLEPNPRGYAFERWLGDLCEVCSLAPRSSFKLIGEQIDGSFVVDGETYLLEAKWHNIQTPAKDLHTFEGKLGQKAHWSRGVFVSYSGFTVDGLHAFGRSKKTLCIDGLDITETLNRGLPFAALVTAKARRAVETGDPFTPFRDLGLT